ncbi:MAG: type II toxin-antitoxin system HicB family antitoxin [Desulfurellaceae bacterium]|nr:type II toxin-antitoxin system HicB family antitoxin [Desulfurellaceae bacterium]
MRYVYPCVLTPEEGGGFFARFPDVPGALTCGDDRAEALAMAEDALAVALAARLGLSESVVRRLVNLDHRSHISHVEKALRAVGRKLAVEDQAA